MSADLKYLPNSIALMFKLYSGKLELKKVSDLVEEQLLFVEDGNHGEYRPLPHEFVDEGVPFVRPPNLINGRIDLNECQKINDEAFRRVRKGIGRGGDIVLTHNATIGRVAITKVTEPVFVTNPQTTVWRSVNWDVIDPKFLYYFMCSAGFQEQLEYHKGRNATFDYVSLTKQRSLIIPVLEISIQREIANTLSLLDDKIELNRKINQTLEQIAQAIFKSWFVDFEPVKAKIEAKAAGRDPERAAMCAISGKLEPELDQLPPEQCQQLAATVVLFPDELVESELGVIPVGWEVGKVAELGDIICGKTPPTADVENYGDDVPFITIPDMHGKLVITSTTKSLSLKGANTQKNKYLRPGSICVSCIATPGLVVRVTREAQTNQQINSVVPYEKWGDAYPLFALKLIGDLVRTSGAGGSVFHNLSKSGFEQLNLTICDEKLAKAFDCLLVPIIQRIFATQQESETLATLRDTLLPKLLSGELSVGSQGVASAMETAV